MEVENPIPSRRPGDWSVNEQQFEYMAAEIEDEEAHLRHLAGVRSLDELNISGSKLESLRDLGTGFQLLQVLWIPRCDLSGLAGILALPALRELYASYNNISELHPLDGCTHLELLDLEGNCLLDVESVTWLGSTCPKLQSLALAGNPLCSQPNHQQLIYKALPNLEVLDDVAVSELGGDGESASTPSSLTASSISETTPSVCSTGTALEQEQSLVMEGIKHARVGLDSHQFKELEMSLMLASEILPSDTRPATSVMMMPMTAGAWMRCTAPGASGSAPSPLPPRHSCDETNGRPTSSLALRLATSRPFSGRPGTSTSRPTTGSTGTAPSSASNGGLYWKKNRLGFGSGSGTTMGRISDSDDGEDSSQGGSSSSLTCATGGLGIGGSLAKDLRNRKKSAAAGLLARPMSAESAAAAQQLHQQPKGAVITDTSSLLDSLCKWKVTTADKALQPSEDESAEGAGTPWEGGERGSAPPSTSLDRTTCHLDTSNSIGDDGDNWDRDTEPCVADVLQLPDSSEACPPACEPMPSHQLSSAPHPAVGSKPGPPHLLGAAPRHALQSTEEETSPYTPSMGPAAPRQPTAKSHSFSLLVAGGVLQQQRSSDLLAPKPAPNPGQPGRGPSKMLLHKVLRDQGLEVDRGSASGQTYYLAPVQPPASHLLRAAAANSDGAAATLSTNSQLLRSSSKSSKAGSPEIDLRSVNPRPQAREDEPDSDDDLYVGLDD
eukprot:gene26558-18325_t